jgi:hypothetical protein
MATLESGKREITNLELFVVEWCPTLAILIKYLTRLKKLERTNTLAYFSWQLKEDTIHKSYELF